MPDRKLKTGAELPGDKGVAVRQGFLAKRVGRTWQRPGFSHRCLIMFALWMSALTCFSVFPLQSVEAQVDQRGFEESMREWKSVYIQVAECFQEMRTCEEAEFQTLKDELKELKSRGDQHMYDAIEKATVIYKSSDQNIEEIKTFLAALPVKVFEAHRYGLAAEINNALLKHDPQNTVYMFDGIKAAFFSNKYDLCADLLARWKTQYGSLPEQLEPISAFLNDYRTAWHEQEKELAEAVNGPPRPRLELGTDNGTIVIELDEDKFPIVVNNLVNHVSERALYPNFQFFEVLEHQVARSGCPMNNGSTTLKLATLNPETMQKPHWHFRGTFTLLVNGNNGDATTQFYICRIPMPEFNGRFLPVGRVVSGMEIVDELTATFRLDEKLVPVPIEGSVPDVITSAKITQKRDHPYVERDELQ